MNHSWNERGKPFLVTRSNVSDPALHLLVNQQCTMWKHMQSFALLFRVPTWSRLACVCIVYRLYRGHDYCCCAPHELLMYWPRDRCANAINCITTGNKCGHQLKYEPRFVPATWINDWISVTVADTGWVGVCRHDLFAEFWHRHMWYVVRVTSTSKWISAIVADTGWVGVCRHDLDCIDGSSFSWPSSYVASHMWYVVRVTSTSNWISAIVTCTHHLFCNTCPLTSSYVICRACDIN